MHSDVLALEKRIKNRIGLLEDTLNAQFYNKCRTVLKRMREEDKDNLFLSDPSRLVNYSKVVKKPMCWQFIAVKLDNFSYPASEDFVADMRLVFTNCYSYNAPTSQVANTGRRLEIMMEDLFMAELGVASPTKEEIKQEVEKRDFKAVNGKLKEILRLYENYSEGQVDLQLCKNATRRRIFELARAAPPKSNQARAPKSHHSTTGQPKTSAAPPPPPASEVKRPPKANPVVKPVELDRVPQNSRTFDVKAADTSPLQVTEDVDFDEMED
ncbi:Bromodomain, putative [Angomonas deanei]|uniref:Bromodomain, putative n=1 Tax=Angomonas deanei TaxID=59799 RepID=A0A7G2C1B9_9TRYP|nr:Bromodomain, putative [Angomonas deanei]